MKIAIMIIACLVVVLSQTFILMGFLKKLKKIEADFWGTAEKLAREDIHKARAEQKSQTEEETEEQQ